MNLSEAEDIAFEHFRRSGFTIDEWPFLAASLEWRPRALISRFRQGRLYKAALVIRENSTSYKDQHNWTPLVETRRQLSDLSIYFVVPDTQSLEPLKTELQELGIGLYVIKPDRRLEKLANDRVPFDDIVITYPIEPDKPYRNRQNVLKVLAHSSGYIWWLDKHFTGAGVEYLYDFLMNWPNRNAITEIKILGSNLVRASEITNLRARIRDLRAELQPLSVLVEMRLINNQATLNALHDRYLISADTAFNIMPTKSLASGQLGSLTLEENPPNFMTIWNAAGPL